MEVSVDYRHRSYPPDGNPAHLFGGENWGDVWPEKPEPGCLAACLADFKPTDPDARISGLAHAYLSVAANEGAWTFHLFLVFGTALSGLAAWLFVHLIETRKFPLLAPLTLSLLLGVYCWGYIALTYRFRCLLYEVLRFGCVDTFQLSWAFVKRTAKAAPLSLLRWQNSERHTVQDRIRSDENTITRPASNLCAVCSGMVAESRLLRGSMPSGLLRWNRPKEVCPHHSLVGLKSCAVGCPLCALLLASIRARLGGFDSTVAVPDTPLQASIFEQQGPSEAAPCLGIQLAGKQIETEQPVVISKLEGLEEFGRRQFPTWATAAQWIGSCHLNHELCHAGYASFVGRSDTFIPPLLLKIRGSGSEKGKLLVSTVEIVSNPRGEDGGPPEYLAFSRSWGFEEPATDGTATIGDLRQPTNVEELTGSLRRAVTITASLGFRYLWIDLVCVDLANGAPQQRSEQMIGMIFAHASCTIMTARPLLSSEDPRPSHGDFILERLEEPKPGLLEFRPFLAARLSVGQTSASDLVGIDALFQEHVDRHGPNRHPQAFQERLLSRRLLFVADGSPVFFECDTVRTTPHHQHGVGYKMTPTIKTGERACAPEASFLGLTYSYRTREKMVDPEKGVFKWETLVIPTMKKAPSQQRQLEDLRGSRAWRRYRGYFHRLLRADPGGSMCVISNTDRWAQKLSLHNAWYNLVAEFTSLGRSSLDVSPMGGGEELAEIAAIIQESQQSSGGVGGFVDGLWLGLLPVDILWHRVGRSSDEDVHNPTSPSQASPLFPELPSWSWTCVGGPVSSGLVVPPSPNLRMSSLAKSFAVENTPADPDGENHSSRLHILHYSNLLGMGEIQSQDKTGIFFDSSAVTERPCHGEEEACLPLLLTATLDLGPGGFHPHPWQKYTSREVHGLVIVKEGDGSGDYRRVGYFRTGRPEVVEKALLSAGTRTPTLLRLR